MGGVVASFLCECACCMACSCFAGVVNFTLSQAARLGHFLIVFSTLLLAVILGLSAPDYFGQNSQYTQIQLESGCDPNYTNNCVYRQLVYRASFSLFILFIGMAPFVYCNDYTNRSFWIIKFAIAYCVFVAFWWADNNVFAGFAEACRIFSFIWLLVQGLLFIDFAHDLHDIVMKDTDDAENMMPQVYYLSLSIGSLVSAIVGLVYLYMDYSGCDIGAFFVTVTLVAGVLTTVASLLNVVNKGLLTPSLMFAYSVFMCWYALLSNPNESCNPTADSFEGGRISTSIAVVLAISLTVVLYCVINGTRIFNVFDPTGQGVLQSYQSRDDATQQQALNAALTGVSPTEGALQKQSFQQTVQDSPESTDEPANDSPASSGSPMERLFFVILMALVACYGAMILTNWGKTDGSPAGGSGSNQSSVQSQWLKIVAQWLSLAFYAKILHAAYITNRT